MKCRNKGCGREIDDDSIYCKWCGEKQIRQRKKKEEISVPKPLQLPSGSWRIVLRAEGESVTEPTPELCIARAKAIRAGFLERQKSIPGGTLSQAVDRYIERRENTLSPTTIRAYRIIQKNRFKVQMAKSIKTPTDWQKVCSDEAALCSAKTLKNAWLFVSSVLRENGIDVPKVKLPQQQQSERKWLDPDQIITFCQACRGKPVEREALLALMSLRRSEILALKWADVDLGHDCIRVHSSLTPDENNKYVLKETTKSKTSTRSVPILIPRLRELLEDQGTPDELISTEPPNGLWRKINDICRSAELPAVGIHGLRHSFASLAYHLGYKEEECMRIGGWSDFKVMHEIYTHLAAKDIKKKTDVMYKFYKKNT